MDNTEIAQTIRAKYGNESASPNNYDDQIVYIEQNDSLDFDLGFDLDSSNIDRYDLFEVYIDNKLSIPAHYMIQRSHDGVYIKGNSVSGANFTIRDTDKNVGSLDGEYMVDREESTWGNLGQFFVVQYYDLETGEQLDEPIVYVIRVNRNLNAVYANYSVSPLGEPFIQWDGVEGADDYIVMSTTWNTEDDSIISSDIIGVTSDTFYLADDGVGQGYRQNQDFAKLAQDPDNQYVNYYSVLAINDNGESSAVEQIMYGPSYAAALPSNKAYAENSESIKPYYSFTDLPVDTYIQMCDSSVVKRTLTYDTSNVIVKDRTYELSVEVPYSIDGTKLIGSYFVFIDSDDEDKLDDMLAELDERQAALKGKGGADDDINYRVDDNEEMPDQEEINEQNADATDSNLDDIIITGTTALSEYIGYKLVLQEEYIDLTEFPESVDTEVVFDALLEASEQNPLCLSIADAAYNSQAKTLKVVYKEKDKQEAFAKQREILDKVNEVVEEIITDDMSDYDKSMAINQYICETVEYNTEALETAAEYNYVLPEDLAYEYRDNFTPYGALIDGVGVCASYADAYKMLADKANLPCIVVTGTATSGIGHAWNRVCLDNQWLTVDSTNNDIEVFPNAFMLLPDDVAQECVGTEEETHLIDKMLDQFTSDTDEYEFYHVNHLFFDKDEAIDEFVNRLNDGEDMVWLRVGYSLSEDEAREIFNEVASQIDINIQGYPFAGIMLIFNPDKINE